MRVQACISDILITSVRELQKARLSIDFSQVGIRVMYSAEEEREPWL